jgi:hypothetical protein
MDGTSAGWERPAAAAGGALLHGLREETGNGAVRAAGETVRRSDGTGTDVSGNAEAPVGIT